MTTSGHRVTVELSHLAATLEYGDVPQQVKDEALLRLLDLSGIALRALRESDSDAAIRTTLRHVRGCGQSTALGEPDQWSAPHAALLNATLAHTLDFDDTHEAGSLHPGVVVIPACLALAEELRTEGSEFIVGVVVGYEIACRVATALNPGSLYSRGFHPTSVAGIIGAAAACARLLRLPPERVEDAIGIAASHAAGIMQFFENGAWTKRLHAGQAAHDALLAARLAAAGFRGPTLPLEGRHGLFAAYSDDADPGAAVRAIGEEWQLPLAAIKAYPACRYAHGPLDALMTLVRVHDLAAAEVDVVEIFVSQTAAALIAEPADEKRRPQNIVDGQFSMHFLAAAVLARGQFRWEDYALLAEPSIEALMDRVHVRVDDDATAAYPERWLTRVVLRTRRGDFQHELIGSQGSADRPMLVAEVIAKFDALVAPVLADHDATELCRAWAELPSAPDLGRIGALLRRATSVTTATKG